MLLNQHSLEVAKFAADIKTRPVLGALNIRTDRVVATDAYHLLEVEHPLQEHEPVNGISTDATPGLIPADAALHAGKNIPKEESLFALKHAFTAVSADGRKMTLATTDLYQEKTVEALMIEGTYPNYETIFPEGEPTARITLDAKYLKDIAEYFTKHADSRRVQIEFFGDDKPIVFRGKTSGTFQKVRGVIMPLRSPGEEAASQSDTIE